MNNYYIRQDAIENNSIESEKLNCLVTSVSASSTDTEVPTAKCLYDITIGRDDFIVTATYNSNDNTYSVDHSAYEVILATRGGKKAYLKYENVYYPASFISGTENSSRVIYSSVFGDISDNNLSNIRIVRYNHKGTTLTYDSSVIPTLDDLSKKQDKNFIVTTNLEGTLADQSSEAVNQQYNLGKNIYLNFLGETLIPLVVSLPGFSVYSTISGSIVNDSYNDKMIDNPTIVTILQEDTSLTFDQRSYSDVAFSGSYESLTDVPDLSLKEDKNNKVNSITSQSEDSQYPSAKAVYELVNGHDYSLDYLTFVAKSSGTFKFSGSSSTNTIQYSTDNGKTWSETARTVEINVNSGDKVLWKGSLLKEFNYTVGSFSTSTASFDILGNIMSLIYSDNFKNKTTLEEGVFTEMFRNTACLDASNLILPSTTLSKFCYLDMFRNCTSLTIPPKLPADVLKLECYKRMFYGCTSLHYIKMLATDVSANDCLNNWVDGVASSGTFVKSASMTTLPSGVNGIPEGWQVYNEEDYELVRLYQLSNKENISNKVISISDSSTNEEYPSAKAVYELVVKGHDYSKDYLTFVAKSDGTFVFAGTSTGDNTANTIQYSTDNGTTWSEPSQNVSINVNNGDAVLFKGEMITPTRYQGIGRFNESTASFDIQGNIMSLLFGDNFVGQLTLANNVDAFYRLFLQTKCVDASNLILPATTLSEYCYAYMFNGCTSLTKVPLLPATTLATSCCLSMFNSCTSLTTPPQLPATTLATTCYYGMFSNCTSLTTAPQLPATTLASSCYYQMFQGCTSLTTAPELLAPTLVSSCYNSMFNRCSSLNYIKMLAVAVTGDTTLASCINYWVKDVAASGTFVKATEMTEIPLNNINGIPTGWNVYNEEEYELVRLYQLSNKENTSNKVISISSESTDEQYPSAKCVYDLIGNIENLLNEL